MKGIPGYGCASSQAPSEAYPHVFLSTNSSYYVSYEENGERYKIEYTQYILSVICCTKRNKKSEMKGIPGYGCSSCQAHHEAYPHVFLSTNSSYYVSYEGNGERYKIEYTQYILSVMCRTKRNKKNQE